MLVYIWGIREFCLSFTVCILALGLASNAVRGEGCSKLGFCWETFPASLRALWPAIVAASGLLLAGGLVMHTFRDVALRTAVEGFGIYCAWGLFQQYMLNGFLLLRLTDVTESSGGAMVMVASIFSIVHAPNWFLMAVTFPAGLISSLVYVKHRNLWILGLAHAVFGCLLYLVVPDSISHALTVGPSCWNLCQTGH